MLVIREAQLKLLKQAQLERHESALMSHLRLKFPGAHFMALPESLAAFTQEGTRVARTMGVTNQYDVRRFLELQAEYGDDFYRKDWAAKILHDPHLSGCGKMERLDDYSFYTLRQSP